MLLRLALGASVAILTLASAGNNWQHMKGFGPFIVALVLAAEMAKPLLPVALIHHARNAATMQWVGTLVLWLLIVVFSFVNTFGNALTRHAMEKERLKQVHASATRPEHVILKDLAQIPQCTMLVEGKGKQAKKMPNVACEKQGENQRKSFEAELRATKAREGTHDESPVAAYTVEDGYVTLASMLGWKVPRYQLTIWVIILWTLLCELGSALGGLAIPQQRENVKRKD